MPAVPSPSWISTLCSCFRKLEARSPSMRWSSSRPVSDSNVFPPFTRAGPGPHHESLRAPLASKVVAGEMDTKALKRRLEKHLDEALSQLQSEADVPKAQA